MIADCRIRRLQAEDLPRLHEIRKAAFAPVFASFRKIVGDESHAPARRAYERAGFGPSLPSWYYYKTLK